jgi:thiol:disulfide interchange protein
VARFLTMLVCFVGLHGAALAADVANPFRVEAELLKLKSGQAGAVRVTIAVPKDHHLYKDMIEIVVTQSGALQVGAPSLPPGLSKPDPADPSTSREVYDMNVIIEVPVAAMSATGRHPLTLSVTYQGCKKSLCWMPQTDVVRATVLVQ